MRAIDRGTDNLPTTPESTNKKLAQEKKKILNSEKDRYA